MLFLILLLAHVTGDFPLQTDLIYQLKTKSKIGGIPHILICTLVNIFVLIPYIHFWQTWAAIAALAIVHFILDTSKIYFTQKTKKDNLLFFSIDQVLHFAAIWIAASWLDSTLTIQEYKIFGILITKKNIIYIISLVFSIFASVPIVYYIQRYWYKKITGKTIPYPGFRQKISGYLERFVTTGGILLGGIYLLFPLLILFLIFIKHKQNTKYHTIAKTASFIIALFSGFAVLLV